MKLRPSTFASTFAAPLTVVVLSALTGCKSSGNTTSANTAGAPAAGVGVVVSGTGAVATAGIGSPAGTGGVAGRPSAAGMSGGTAGAPTPTTAGTTGGSGATSTAGASGGATAGTGSAGTIPATFQTVKVVLGGGGSIMPCAAAPCHGVNGAAPPSRPLELPPTNDQQLYTNLTTYVSKACGDLKLVTPGNPEQSALLKILSGPCGTTPRMPYGCTAEADDCIPAEYVAAVRQWIVAGAPRP